MLRTRIALLAAICLALAGCDQDAAPLPGPGGAYSESGDGDGSGSVAIDDGAGDGDGDTGQPTGSQLTAGVWDDNLNYDYFLDYLQDEEQDLAGAPSLTEQERDAANAEFGGAREPNQELDVAIVLDTTGSMGDELSYLAVELQQIAAQVDTLTASGEVRWALIVYRDAGDEYVTRVFNFQDLDALSAALGEQSVAGGGDYAEASEAGLADLQQLSWRTDDEVARMAFWITDAPHHAEKESELTTALRNAEDKDLHLYPVAASGVDKLAELTMRSAAQLTGGRYLFLTDDSGIGGEHLEPTIPCYFVTLLEDAMVRMAKIELTGEYVEPSSDDIIRVGGDPQDGACTLEDGTEVLLF